MKRNPSALSRWTEGYDPKNEIPLGSYALLVGAFNVLLGTFLWRSMLGRSPESRDETPSVPDVLMLGIATHKLSRVITKDIVMAPFRAPFTRYEEDLGYGEVNEKSRGEGLRQVIGELLSCNYCADMWVGLGLISALKKFPHPTRLLMQLLSGVAAADFLHVFYENQRTQENIRTLHEEKLSHQAG